MKSEEKIREYRQELIKESIGESGPGASGTEIQIETLNYILEDEDDVEYWKARAKKAEEKLKSEK